MKHSASAGFLVTALIVLFLLLLAMVFSPAFAEGVPPQIGYDPVRAGVKPPVVVVAPQPTAPAPNAPIRRK